MLVWVISFFRDPRREIPTTPGLIVAPADGKIAEDWYNFDQVSLLQQLGILTAMVLLARFWGRTIALTVGLVSLASTFADIAGLAQPTYAEAPRLPLDDADADDRSRLRVHLTRGQAAAFCARADDVVSAGRPPCMWCSLPIDPDGHPCPRMN